MTTPNTTSFDIFGITANADGTYTLGVKTGNQNVVIPIPLPVLLNVLPASVFNVSNNALTISTSAYSANTQLGGILTFAGAAASAGAGGTIQSVVVTDSDNIKAGFDLFLFQSMPASPPGDTSSFTLDAADLLKVFAVIPVTTGNYISMASGGAIASLPVTYPFISVDTNLYGLLMGTGTPTYVHADALNIRLGIKQ